ncbi:MAG: sigma-54 dependent transcriptional regulator [Gemmatimonadota bacterium]
MIEAAAADGPLHVLVVDDEELLLRSATRILEAEGYVVTAVTRGQEALDRLQRRPFDLLLTDLALPDVDGMTLLRETRSLDTPPLVVIITAFASVESSLEAVRSGAYDYLPKPFTATQLQVVMGRAAAQVRLERDVARLRHQLSSRDGLMGVVGTSEPMRAVADIVSRVAPSSASVLITGESGTGKELVARALHRESRRAQRRFVAINCAALPGHLLESELFGHEKGAFTGADNQRQGLLEYASGGTFFLDEICEMSLDLQAKLLRVLQEGEARRVGGEEERALDVRFIAATNLDPRRAVTDGRLRQDLFFRLNVVPLALPALRERRDDIPLLVEHFLRRAGERYERPGMRVLPAAMDRLMAYGWPGNVRELQNAVERMVLMASQETLGVALLPAEIRGGDAADAAGTSTLHEQPYHEARGAVVASFERRYLAALLEETEGNVSEAARRAGIDRKTIHRMLDRHGLTRALEPRGDPSM